MWQRIKYLICETWSDEADYIHGAILSLACGCLFGIAFATVLHFLNL